MFVARAGDPRGAHIGDFLEQRIGLADRVGGEPLPVGRGEIVVQLRVAHGGEQGLAGGKGVHGRALPDIDGVAQGMQPDLSREGFDHLLLAHEKGDGLVELVPNGADRRIDQILQAWCGSIGPQPVQRRAGRIVAATAAQIVALLQRGEQVGQAADRDGQGGGDLVRRHGAVLANDRLQDVERANR